MGGRGVNKHEAERRAIEDPDFQDYLKSQGKSKTKDIEQSLRSYVDSKDGKGSTSKKDKLKAVLDKHERVKNGTYHTNFFKITDRQSNIANSDDTAIQGIHQSVSEKYGEDHVHVQTLQQILESDDEKFKQRKKFILSQDPSFRQMVDAVNEEE